MAAWIVADGVPQAGVNTTMWMQLLVVQHRFLSSTLLVPVTVT
jgi:hypothetical protein